MFGYCCAVLVLIYAEICLPLPQNYCMSIPSVFCCKQNVDTSSPLFATAPYYRHLFLLELNEPFQHDALADSGLPDVVKQHFATQLANIPSAKLLCIRQQHTTKRALRLLYAPVHAKQVYVYHFEDYNELLSCSLSAWVEQPAMFSELLNPNMFLVCTNGKRDQCCAKFGIPIYEKLLETVGEQQVWQCSHLGGHRFAPTLIVLPQHHCYGYLSVENITAFIALHQQGKIAMDYWRGNCGYPPAVQAADYFLRQHQHSFDYEAALLKNYSPAEQTTVHRAVWAIAATGKQYIVQYSQQLSTDLIYESCSKKSPIPYTYYSLQTLEQIAP